MRIIKDLVKTKRLYLTWQPQGLGSRHIVGEILEKDGNYVFSYLTKSEDYLKACECGFIDYPAFKIRVNPYVENVIEVFMKRLPSPKRHDYKRYLNSFLLPSDFSDNDFTLLTHTSAKLPSDGFTLVPDLSDAPLPFEYMTEVAGTRHHLDSELLEMVGINDDIKILAEENNEKDPNALALMCEDIKIGYVNRVLATSLRGLLKHRFVSAKVAKVTMNDKRPLIHILIRVE